MGQYCQLIRQQLEDQAIKVIWLSFLQATAASLADLPHKAPQHLQQLLQEAAAAGQQRSALLQKIADLEKAREVLLRVRTGTGKNGQDEVVDLC